MRCNHCGAIINSKTNKCPICYASINVDGISAFPKKKHKQFPTRYATVLLVFLGIIDITTLILNLVYDPNFLWSLLVIICSIYFFFICSLIFRGGQKSLNIKLNLSTVLLTILFLILKYTVRYDHWLVEAWLPAQFIASELIMWIYTIIKGNYSSTFLVSRIFLYSLGIIPIAAAYYYNFNEKIASIVASSISMFALLICILVNIKSLNREYRRFFSHK